MTFSRIALIGFLVILFWSVCACAQASRAVNNYQECVDAGYKILKTYPPRCISPDGKVFQTDVFKPQELQEGKVPPANNSPKKLCVDKCGDGKCQEMVCMGEGCPCAESRDTCAKDCH